MKGGEIMKEFPPIYGYMKGDPEPKTVEEIIRIINEGRRRGKNPPEMNLGCAIKKKADIIAS
jgi:uncharacterized radical SAM superfamily protein